MESLDLQIRSEACKCIEMKACKVNYRIQGFQLNACKCIVVLKVIFILQACQTFPTGAGMSSIGAQSTHLCWNFLTFYVG